MGSTTMGEDRTGRQTTPERTASKEETADAGVRRIARDTEQLVRDAAATGATAASTATSTAPATWPDMLGLWSADGRSLTQLGLAGNLRAGDRMMQEWRAALDAQRLAMDTMRDVIRRQQDLTLASWQALFGALTQEAPQGDGAPRPERSVPEQAATEMGQVMRRQMEAAWAGWQVMLKSR